MSKKLYTIVMIAALVASAFGFTASGALAASAAGTGPGDALTPAGQWTPLATGQQAWYAFRYEGDGSQILVRMSVDPASSAAFEVWTPAQVQQWAAGDKVSPVGRGSVDSALGGDLVWTGNFKTSGTYYVIVSQTGSTPANYSLQVSGSAVSFMKTAEKAAEPASVAQTAAPAATATSAAKPAAETKSGKSPADALTAAGQWAPLAVGQQVWYTFSYSGDGSQVQARMAVYPSGSADFAVWTAADLERSAQDSSIKPVGRGSVDNALGGDLVWVGSFNTGGTYYVVVTQNGSTPANYSLTIK